MNTETVDVTVTIINDESDLSGLVTRFCAELSSPCVIFCSGELGAGKTTFARHLAEKLGVPTRVTSPTFNILKEYELASVGGKFVHCDLFRLTAEDDLIEIGILDAIAEGDNIVFVEWPQLLDKCGINPDILINLTVLEDEKRKVEIEFFH